ncbi:aminotransferase GliI [Niveomyces insectorum RCEF 264]|uniref:Aminotransferase GliI n=1 Tax=Niveomyces insectorum RCEF 264 TaxID=1081102 RepID=A0A167W7F3_9HYPO|nr:aminotransferase GliI [Niveomyces insectorum RCEF 264]
MLSRLCQERNKTIIPGLLSQHSAVLTGDAAVVDLSTAENWSVKELLLSRIRTALSDLSDEDLAYASGVGGCTKTRTLLAELFNSHFHPAKKLDASNVVLAAGGSFALTALVEQICEPGDGILIAAPYWAGLDISISVHCYGKIVPVHVPLDKFFLPESVHYYEDALRNNSVPIKAVLVCNPHNPLGQCYPRETLEAMRMFCAHEGLHYISDEVYALSSHKKHPVDAVPYMSVLELEQKEVAAEMHVIYSMSKDFGCNGIRLGALVSQSNEALRLSAALSVHSQVSSLSTVLASKLLTSDTVQYVTEFGGARLREAYLVISSFFEANRMRYIPAYYGMFVFVRLVDLHNMEEEKKLQSCLKANAVSLSTGSSYHFKEAGWFRICYGVPLADLRKGLKRIEAGIAEYSKGR